MRLVLDTNIWLDWLVFADPQVGPLRAAHAAGQVQICIDAACEAELVRVLAYRLRKAVLDPAAQAVALACCRGVALPIATLAADTTAVAPPLPTCRDRDDQKFLDLARAARCEFLLTKDRALLDLARRKYASIGFRILTLQGFNRVLAEAAPA